MFGLGGWEIAILGLAALIFFGPQKLPQLMRQAGKVMREVRKASYEFQTSLEREMEDDPYRKSHRREKKRREKAEKLGLSPDELAPKPAPPAGVASASAPAPDANGGSSGTPATGPAAAPDPAPAPEPEKKSSADSA